MTRTEFVREYTLCDQCGTTDPERQSDCPLDECGIEDQPALRDEVTVREWQPIETAPEEGVLHLRGLWVYTLNSAGKKFPAYFQADCGVMNDDGDFVSASGDDFGWSADDYDWWMPMPQAAPPTPDALRALAEGGE